MAFTSKYPIGFILDSSCDMPDDLRMKPNIYRVPLFLHIGNEVFQDGITISKDEFYKRLEETDITPSTAPPTPEIFAIQFRKVLQACDKVIVMTINSAVSDTYKNATKAWHALDEDLKNKVTVIDTKGIAGTAGLILSRVYQHYLNKMSYDELVRTIKIYIRDVRQFAYIDDIRFLKRSGRITVFKGILAKVLNVSPILKMQSGEESQKIGTVKKGEINKYVGLIAEHMLPKYKYEICVTHVKAVDYIHDLIQGLENLYKESEIKFQLTTGPVLGAVVGFGSISVSFLRTDE